MVEFARDGGRVAGYLAVPEKNGEGPGILVLHAWWGLNEAIKVVCDRLAFEGFVALAPDLYHGEIARDIAQAEKLSEALKYDEARDDVVAAADYLLEKHPAVKGNGIGVIGFSLGGSWALLAAAKLKPREVKAVVTFYGLTGGIDREDYARSQAAFQGHFAEQDPFEPLEGVRQVQALIQSAGRPVEFFIYPQVQHWFLEPDRPDAFNQEAAQRAWNRAIPFLHEHLDGR